MAGLSEAALADDSTQLTQALKAQFRVLSRALHPDKQLARANGLATKDFQLLKTVKECLEGESTLARYLKKLRAFRQAGKFKVQWHFEIPSGVGRAGP